MVLPRRVWDYIRSLGSEGAVYAEVRGWRFDLVSPRYRYRPSVSEVAGFCPSHRDVYLQRVQGLRPPQTGRAQYGVLVHEFFLEPFRLVDRGVDSLEELVAGRYRLERRLGVRDRFLRRVYELGAILALQSRVDGDIPVRVEPPIPGAPVGLSDTVRPDLLVGLIPVEVTASGPWGVYGSRKELQLAGYALAIEAWTGVPVDYGVAVHIVRRDDRPQPEWRVVVIDDPLRKAFLRERDEVAMIVENKIDPGPAEGETGCPEWCPYRGLEGCPPRRAR